MTRLLLLLLLLPTLTACVRPRQLDPPGLALGVFHLHLARHPPATSLRGVGLVLQPGRARLGVIRETTVALPTHQPAHLRGRTFECWLLPDSEPHFSPKDSNDD